MSLHDSQLHNLMTRIDFGHPRNKPRQKNMPTFQANLFYNKSTLGTHLVILTFIGLSLLSCVNCATNDSSLNQQDNDVDKENSNVSYIKF